MTIEPVLDELLTYFRLLTTAEETVLGWPRLLTPEVNILALNALYLGQPEQAYSLRAAREKCLPLPLVASTFVLPGQEVGAVRVGTFESAGPKSAAAHTTVAVEQVSRLQLGLWASVLAQAYETPQWAAAIARHLAAKLENDRHSTLLLAYADHEAVGALLWQPTAALGAAHLWGTLEPEFDEVLLGAAAELAGGALRVSLPDSSPLFLPDEQVVTFTLAGP